jgi:hypothetical protein
MDTIRELNIKDFIARAAVMTVAHGYATAIGSKVLRARKTVDPSELPATVIIPGMETAEYLYGKLQCKMSLRVEGIAAFGTEEPSVISERILGDLKKCFLASSWSRSPDYIDSIIYTGGGTSDYPDESQMTVGAFATFEVGYTTNINDPSSQ